MSHPAGYVRARDMPKQRSIKIRWGKREGEIVHVSQVPSGQACGCTCLACNAPLVAHKGKKNVHHFKHDADSACSESVLHIMGKVLLKQRIDAAIQAGVSFPVEWKCDHCDANHSVPLLERAARCSLEVPIASSVSDAAGVRADVGVNDAAGNVFAAVEVVVSHKPDPAAAALYRSREITCIELHLKTEQDLAAIETSSALRASRVNECTMPRCPDCRGFMSQRSVHVVDANCWRCRAPMKIAFGSTGILMHTPEEFAPAEVEAAKKAGARLARIFHEAAGVGRDGERGRRRPIGRLLNRDLVDFLYTHRHCPQPPLITGAESSAG